MIRAGLFSTLTLVAVFAFAPARQMQAAQSSSPDSGVPAGARTIHIDEKCRIVPNEGDFVARKAAHPYHDSAICHLESVADSTHWEERIAGNELLRSLVRVKEHEFVLRDISDEPVMFVVSQTVPENWAIDSDPQPVDIEGRTAYFHVYVKPGQTVRLHVGMRRTWPQKPKPI